MACCVQCKSDFPVLFAECDICRQEYCKKCLNLSSSEEAVVALKKRSLIICCQNCRETVHRCPFYAEKLKIFEEIIRDKNEIISTKTKIIDLLQSSPSKLGSSGTGNKHVSSGTGNKHVNTVTGNKEVNSETGNKQVNSDTGNKQVNSDTGNKQVNSETGNKQVNSETGNKHENSESPNIQSEDSEILCEPQIASTSQQDNEIHLKESGKLVLENSSLPESDNNIQIGSFIQESCTDASDIPSTSTSNALKPDEKSTFPRRHLRRRAPLFQNMYDERKNPFSEEYNSIATPWKNILIGFGIIIFLLNVLFNHPESKPQSTKSWFN